MIYLDRIYYFGLWLSIDYLAGEGYGGFVIHERLAVRAQKRRRFYMPAPLF